MGVSIKDRSALRYMLPQASEQVDTSSPALSMWGCQNMYAGRPKYKENEELKRFPWKISKMESSSPSVSLSCSSSLICIMTFPFLPWGLTFSLFPTNDPKLLLPNYNN